MVLSGRDMISVLRIQEQAGFKLQVPEEGNLSPYHCYQFDAGASSRCLEPGEGSQVSRRIPEVQQKGTPDTKSASLGNQHQCFCANPRSVGNKQEELRHAPTPAGL